MIIPCPVSATKSAAPLRGFVNTPTKPKPTPAIRLLGEAPSDNTDCNG